MRMNFSPFAGHFPGIHQFAASGALVTSSGSTNGSAASHLDPRYTHHHAGTQPSSSSSLHHHQASGGGGQSAHFNQSQLLGKLRGSAEEMNKYGHSSTNGAGNQQGHHYGAPQYSSQEVAENGNKHLRVGNSSHSLGLNSMANGTAYHQSNTDQNQDLGHVSGGFLLSRLPEDLLMNYSNYPSS